MMNYLLESSFCLSVFYAFYYCFLRKDTFFERNRYYLLASSAISLFIPLLELDFALFDSTQTKVLQLQAITVGIQQIEQSISLNELIFLGIKGIYGFFVLFFLCRFLFYLSKLLRIIRQSEVKYCRGYLRIDTEGKLPTFSFFNYLFWDNSQNFSEAEADKVLNHELKHIWDKHSNDLVFIELLKIMFWFNPVMYCYARSLKFQHEFIADAAVLRESDIKTYSKLIVQSFFKKMNLSLAHNFNQSEIKQRIEVMKKLKTPAYLGLKTLVVLPLLLLLIFAFSLKNTQNILPLYDNSSKVEMNRFAQPVGGLDEIYKELTKTLLYPTSARKQGVQGRVFIQFTVFKDGKIGDFKILKSLDKACDKAALEALKKTKTPWLPAKVDGKTVKQNLSIPIFFKLQTNGK